MENTMLKLMDLVKDSTRLTFHRVDRDIINVSAVNFLTGKARSFLVYQHQLTDESEYRQKLMDLLADVQNY